MAGPIWAGKTPIDSDRPWEDHGKASSPVPEGNKSTTAFGNKSTILTQGNAICNAGLQCKSTGRGLIALVLSVNFRSIYHMLEYQNMWACGVR